MKGKIVVVLAAILAVVVCINIWLILFLNSLFHTSEIDGKNTVKENNMPGFEIKNMTPENPPINDISDDGVMTFGSFSISKGMFVNCQKKELIEINIRYPQMAYVEESLSVEKINKLLFETAVSEETRNWLSERLIIEMNYAITYIDENILSVVFGGYSAPTGRYNDLAKAIIIDLNTGDAFDPLDELKERKRLKECIINKKFDAYMYDLSDNSSITELMISKALDLVNNYNVIDSKNVCYVRESKIGLIVDMSPALQRCFYLEFDLDL